MRFAVTLVLVLVLAPAFCPATVLAQSSTDSTLPPQGQDNDAIITNWNAALAKTGPIIGPKGNLYLDNVGKKLAVVRKQYEAKKGTMTQVRIDTYQDANGKLSTAIIDAISEKGSIRRLVTNGSNYIQLAQSAATTAERDQYMRYVARITTTINREVLNFQESKSIIDFNLMLMQAAIPKD